jgi:thiol-disulfide isomerase/thioredoxin
MRHPRSSPRRWTATLSLLALVAVAKGLEAQSSDAAAKPKGEKTADDERAEDAARAAKWLQSAFKGQTTPEAAEMLIAIARGSRMGPGEGWFHPGQGRFGWKWLADRHGIRTGGTIPREKFLGPEGLFARLDRNKDGQLRADDFDWSDRTFYAQQGYMMDFWFSRLNKAADGRLTREEWLKFFDEAARGKDHLTTDNLREALFAMPPPKKGVVPNMPTPEMLVRGLFRGEIGSMNEGPKLNDAAPDFTLKTRDGKETVRLSDHFSKKPIVLVFGNFTCGPFRAVYPRVDEVAVRYKNDAVFLCVYVREAHPTDGWRMGSNDEAGVTFAQPRDYAERAALANRCGTKLKMNMPLLVDEMDDRVGHAYSGMPARLYVIDKAGKVAYKSGRGPFGFKPDEMEQSLVMTLLDQQKAPTTATTKPSEGSK